MKVLFIPCGIGLGHATRTNAIIDEIKEKSDIVVSTYGDAYDYFKSLKLKTYKIWGLTYPKGESKFTLFSVFLENIGLPVVLVRNFFALSEIINKEKPDVVFIDSEPGSFIVANYLKQKDIFLSNLPALFFEMESIPQWISNKLSNQISILEKSMDYMLRYADSIVFPSFIKYKDKPSKIEITNLIVRKKPNSLPSEESISQSLKINEKFYLVSLSSYIGEELTLSIIKSLKQFKDRNFIVTSRYFKKNQKTGNITIFPFLNNYLEYLKISEGLICSSGHSSISEALVYKKPVFAVPIKEHIEQITNAVIIEKYGLGNNYIIKDRFNEEMLKRKLSFYFKNHLEHKLNLKKRDIKSNGAKEIKEIILKLAK